MDLGESRSLTQIFWWNLLLTSDWLWAYECSFGAHGEDGNGDDGDGDDGDDDGVGDGDHCTRRT